MTLPRSILEWLKTEGYGGIAPDMLNALWSHLCTSVEKLDENWLRFHANKECEASDTKQDCFTKGARHQYALNMAAIVRANENAFHLELKHNRIAEELAAAKAEIERLKAELKTYEIGGLDEVWHD